MTDPSAAVFVRVARGACSLLVVVSAVTGCGPGAPEDVPPFTSDPGSAKQGYMLSLGVPDAWKAGAGGVLVAVVDNGVDTSHPDLREKVWTNPAEVQNGLDDDGNGFVDDVHGWNFLDDSGDVGVQGEQDDSRGHGTAAAGILGAHTDNGLGIAGCCPDCAVLVLKARDFERENTVIPRLAPVLDYAVAQGARVVSISDGVLPDDVDSGVRAQVEQAISRAAAQGVLVVASAGNDGREVVRFPALVPEVLAVSSVDWDGKPSSWTSFGPEVDVAATGEYVYSTFPDAQLGYFEGTSAAAPVAAGLAALVMAARPDWTPAEVAGHLRATARPAESGAPIVDYAAAMRALAE